MTDRGFVDFEVTLLTGLGAATALALVLRLLRSSRPGMRIELPIAAAFALRAVSAAAISLTDIAGSLRGGDEIAFVYQAGLLADTPFGSGDWTAALSNDLHNVVFAVQLAVLESPDLALRLTQIGIATIGVILLAAAIYDLAGARAARLAAWLLALEPANVFFSGLLHKEPLLMLAGGLVVFGGTQAWRRGTLLGILPMAAGCVIAIATRQYAGWFVISAATLIALHTALRVRSTAGTLSLGYVLAAAIVLGATIPAMLYATSDRELAKLQASQDANAQDARANLPLEHVDFSSRTAVLTNIPRRIRDVLFRPYPWQVANWSQRLGLIGTAAALLVLVLLTRLLWQRRGTIMERAGPLVYLAVLLLVAYSLSAGNAGTAFRYRTHLVALAVCLVVALRARADPVASAQSGDEQHDPIDRDVPSPVLTPA